MYGPVQGEVKISMTIQLKKGSNGNGATISLPRQPIKKDPTTPLPANTASSMAGGDYTAVIEWSILAAP